MSKESDKMSIQMTREEAIDFMGDGMMESFDPELKRAFDFSDNEVPAELKKPEKLQVKPNSFKVSGDGCFYTVQGEGVSMGEPAVFLRLHICNLKCVWCDAYYTWNPKTKEFWTQAQDWTVEETKQKLEAEWGCENPAIGRRLIITGGEPLLQQQRIDDLLDIMPDWTIEIETNGTIMPSQKILDRCQFNCSPKLANSANQRRARIKQEVMQTLNKYNTAFKFVVMENEDLDEIERDYIQGCGIDPEKVILMPQGVTAEEVRANMRKVVEYAKRKGYRLLGRLQNEIWGAKRRV